MYEYDDATMQRATDRGARTVPSAGAGVGWNGLPADYVPASPGLSHVPVRERRIGAPVGTSMGMETRGIPGGGPGMGGVGANNMGYNAPGMQTAQGYAAESPMMGGAGGGIGMPASTGIGTGTGYSSGAPLSAGGGHSAAGAGGYSGSGYGGSTYQNPDIYPTQANVGPYASTSTAATPGPGAIGGYGLSGYSGSSHQNPDTYSTQTNAGTYANSGTTATPGTGAASGYGASGYGGSTYQNPSAYPTQANVGTYANTGAGTAAPGTATGATYTVIYPRGSDGSHAHSRSGHRDHRDHHGHQHHHSSSSSSPRPTYSRHRSRSLDTPHSRAPAVYTVQAPGPALGQTSMPQNMPTQPYASASSAYPQAYYPSGAADAGSAHASGSSTGFFGKLFGKKSRRGSEAAPGTGVAPVATGYAVQPQIYYGGQQMAPAIVLPPPRRRRKRRDSH